MRRFLAFALVLILFGWLGTGHAFAQDLAAPDESMQGLLDIIKNQASSWNGALKGYASSVFWSLATISFVWTFFPLAVKGGDLSEIGGEFIRFTLKIGFFKALMDHTQDWGEAIVNSFRIAGGRAAGLGDNGLDASSIFGTAVEMAWKMGQVETWNPFTAVAVAFCAVVTLLCFTFIAAYVAVTVIESYIVINAAVFFMGFGGSPWTKDYAIAMLRYAVSVGAKLFVLTLLVGVIVQSANQWMAAYKNDDASMWTILGLGLICAYLCRAIPEMIQGLISGVSPGGGAGIGSMAQIAAVAATAAAAAATGGAAGAAAGASSTGGGVGGLGNLAGGIGGSPAGGSGGLADALKSSLANGPSSAPGASSGSEGPSSAAKASAPRIGGGAASSPSSAGGGGGSSPDNASSQGQGASASSNGSTDATEGNSISAAGADASSVAGTDDGSMAAQADAAAEAAAAPPQEGMEAGQGDDAAQGSGAAPQEATSAGTEQGQGGGAGEAPDSTSGENGSGNGSDAGSSNGAGNEPGAAPKTDAKADAEKAAKEARAKVAGAAARGAMLRGSVRGAGMMAALSVPGMESAASLSLGPKMPGAGGDDSASGEGEPDLKSEEVANTIAPASAPTSSNPGGPGAAPIETPNSGTSSADAPKDGDA